MTVDDHALPHLERCAERVGAVVLLAEHDAGQQTDTLHRASQRVRIEHARHHTAVAVDQENPAARPRQLDPEFVEHRAGCPQQTLGRVRRIEQGRLGHPGRVDAAELRTLPGQFDLRP
ncbi:hypothetical protein GTA26_30085 [Rhodococcus hoagii]|nr:hypothetical protein [Prescottella equi]